MRPSIQRLLTLRGVLDKWIPRYPVGMPELRDAGLAARADLDHSIANYDRMASRMLRLAVYRAGRVIGELRFWGG
jgi:hypothetical protein